MRKYHKIKVFDFKEKIDTEISIEINSILELKVCVQSNYSNLFELFYYDEGDDSCTRYHITKNVFDFVYSLLTGAKQ